LCCCCCTGGCNSVPFYSRRCIALTPAQCGTPPASKAPVFAATVPAVAVFFVIPDTPLWERAYSRRLCFRRPGFWMVYISVSSVTAAGGFALTATYFFFKRQKKDKQKKARPERPAPRWGSAFLRSGIHPGALPSGWLRCTYMQCVRLRRTALRANPRMNTSSQPAEGAGESRSKAEGELTLGLMSGEKQRVYVAPLWERACSRRRPDSRPISCRCIRIPCGSEPAREKHQGNAIFQTGRVIVDVLREQARSHRGMRISVKVRSAVRPPRSALVFDLSPLRQAERRCSSGG
jgi:hypothetical protein